MKCLLAYLNVGEPKRIKQKITYKKKRKRELLVLQSYYGIK